MAGSTPPKVAPSEAEIKADTLSLMDLPTELHMQVVSYLTYPDALSMKHTSRHFKGWVYTGVNLKIEWLIERKRLHLDCPHDQKCELGSDTRFCRGSFGLLMKRRREHGECETTEGGRGCLVFGTKLCTFKKVGTGWRKWFKAVQAALKSEVAFFWVLLGAIGLVLAWMFQWKWRVMSEASV